MGLDLLDLLNSGNHVIGPLVAQLVILRRQNRGGDTPNPAGLSIAGPEETTSVPLPNRLGPYIQLAFALVALRVFRSHRVIRAASNLVDGSPSAHHRFGELRNYRFHNNILCISGHSKLHPELQANSHTLCRAAPILRDSLPLAASTEVAHRTFLHDSTNSQSSSI